MFVMPLEDYLRAVVTPLLNNPSQLEITKTVDEMGCLLCMTVSKYDMGFIIGKDGETSKAVRHLLKLVGLRQKAHVSIKILEPEGSEHYQRPKIIQSDRDLII